MKLKQIFLTLLTLNSAFHSSIESSSDIPYLQIAAALGLVGTSVFSGYFYGNHVTSKQYEKQIAEISYNHIATLHTLCQATQKTYASVLQLSQSPDAPVKLARLIENDETQLVKLCQQINSIEEKKACVDLQILRWKADKSITPEEIAEALAKSEQAEQLLKQAKKIQQDYFSLKPFAHAKLTYESLKNKYADALESTTSNELLKKMIRDIARFETLSSDIAQFNQVLQKLNDDAAVAHEVGYNKEEFKQLTQSLADMEFLFKNAKPYIDLHCTMHDVTHGATVAYNDLLNVFRLNNITNQFDVMAANKQNIMHYLMQVASRQGKPYHYILKFVETLSGNCEIIEHRLNIIKRDLSREIDPTFVNECEQTLEFLKTAKSLILQSNEYKEFLDLRDQEIKREQQLKQEHAHHQEVERLHTQILHEEKARRRAQEEAARELREKNRLKEQKIKALEHQNAIAAQQAAADFGNWWNGTTKEQFEKLKFEREMFANQLAKANAEINRLEQKVREINAIKSSDTEEIKQLKRELLETQTKQAKVESLYQNHIMQARYLRDMIIANMNGLSPESEEYHALNSYVGALTTLAY